jgi:hypothetical protein
LDSRHQVIVADHFIGGAAESSMGIDGVQVVGPPAFPQEPVAVKMRRRKSDRRPKNLADDAMRQFKKISLTYHRAASQIGVIRQPS